MPLQLNTIEEYDFPHGFHRNYVTGKYIAIQPHDLGRPLTHAEMDYNLILNEQTQAGFRIFGSNEDLTLSDDDLGSSLVFHKISADDDDFARYQSKGYSVGQYIWILDCCAPKFNCALFVVDSITSNDSGVCSFVVDSITATPEDPCISFVVDTICSFEVESIESENSGSDDVLPTPTATEVPATPTPEPTATEIPATPTPTATEVPATPTPTATIESAMDRYSMTVTPPTAEESSAGNQYMQFNIQAINGYNPPAGTTVGYTITGDWEFADIQVIGTNIGDGNNVSEPFPLIESPGNPYSDIFRIGEQGAGFKTAAIRVYATNDQNIEGLEQVTVTLASEDSLGNSTSSTEVSATGEIIDVTPTPTAAPAPTPIPPTPTATEAPATPTPTATEVPATPTPTPTPTVDPSLTRFSWLLATDESFAQPIDAVLEDLDNDPNECWSNSFLLQQQDAAGRQFEYFPIQPGNTYYFKLNDNIPTTGFIQNFQLYDTFGITLEHESIGGRGQGLDLSASDICGIEGIPYIWKNDPANSMVYAHSPSHPGWIPATNDTKTEFGGQVNAPHFTVGYNPNIYVKIQVPENMQVGSMFKFGNGINSDWYIPGTYNIINNIDHLDFTPGLYTDINFKVVENPNLAPTPTPTPTYDLSSAAAVSENGQWSLHVTDHDSGAVINPVIVDITQEYNASGGTGSLYYKYFPIAANEKIKVHMEQHFGTLNPYPDFVVYNQSGHYSHDSIDNTATVVQYSPLLTAFSDRNIPNYNTTSGFIDNKSGTDVLPLLNHPNEMVQIALNTPSEPFIVGRPDGLGTFGNTTMLWISEGGAGGGGTMINLVSLPDGMTPPTTYEELDTPPQPTSNLTFDYHVPLTLDGYTYGLQKPNGDSFGYYEDVSWTVNNPSYWGHEIFAEPYGGHQWTSTNQLVFEVDGNQIIPDGTIQNNISIVTQIESDGRLSILTKSHNINEDRVHEIRITGGPELVDPSITIDPPIQRPMLGLNAYNTWMDLVDQWEQANPNCEYYPDFDHNTGSFLQTDLLGVTNTEMFDWGLGTAGRKRFMLRVLSETRALDMDLLNEFGTYMNCLSD